MRFAFRDYELDDEQLELRRDGFRLPIQPKVIDLLLYLVKNRDGIVLKRDVLAAIWPGVVISDSALSRAILRARKAIGDDLQQIVVTVHGRGFRFAAPVVERSGPPDAPASEPLVDETFVGRAACLAVLQDRLDLATAGRGSAVWLSGDVGIGKTRAAAELLRRVRAGGGMGWHARGIERRGGPPFHLWTQVARAAAADRVDLAATRMLEAARPLIAGEAVSPSAEPLLFDEFTRYLFEMARGAPCVVVLDDLEAADLASLRLLQFVVRRLGTSSLLLVGAYGAEGHPDDERARALRAVVHERAGHALTLRGLSLEETARFVEVASGVAPSETLARELRERSGGNPLFLLDLLKSEHVEQALNDAAVELGTPMDLEQRLVETIGRRAEELSAATREALTTASALGREFDLVSLAVVSGAGASETELAERMEEAIGARLLVKAGPRRYRFEPTLVRDVVYSNLKGADRVELHRRAADRLAAHLGSSAPAQAAVLARHFARGLPAASPERALEFAVRAAREDATRGDHRGAEKHWGLAAYALTYVRGEKERRIEVHLGLAKAYVGTDRAAAAREAFLDATVLARALSLPMAFAEAALGLARLVAVSPTYVADAALVRSLLDEAHGAIALLDDDGALRLRADLEASRA